MFLYSLKFVHWPWGQKWNEGKYFLVYSILQSSLTKSFDLMCEVFFFLTEPEYYIGQGVSPGRRVRVQNESPQAIPQLSGAEILPGAEPTGEHGGVHETADGDGKDSRCVHGSAGKRVAGPDAQGKMLLCRHVQISSLLPSRSRTLVGLNLKIKKMRSARLSYLYEKEIWPCKC